MKGDEMRKPTLLALSVALILAVWASPTLAQAAPAAAPAPAVVAPAPTAAVRRPGSPIDLLRRDDDAIHDADDPERTGERLDAETGGRRRDDEVQRGAGEGGRAALARRSPPELEGRPRLLLRRQELRLR